MLGLAGVAVPLLSVAGCGGGDDDEGGGDDDPGKVDAYKLSPDGQTTCNACKKHARNKLFTTAVIADAHRAHPGCNCKVKKVRIPAADAARFFRDFPYYDKRSAVS